MAPFSISGVRFGPLFVLHYLLIIATYAFTTPGGAKRLAVRLGSPTSRPARLLSYFDDILGKRPDDGNKTSSVSHSNLVPPSASENAEGPADKNTNATKVPRYSFLGIVTESPEELPSPDSAPIPDSIDESVSVASSSDDSNGTITESKMEEKAGDVEADKSSSLGSTAPPVTGTVPSSPESPLPLTPPPKPYGAELVSYLDTVHTPPIGLNSYLDSVSAPPPRRYGATRQEPIFPSKQSADSGLISYFDNVSRPSPIVPPPAVSQSDVGNANIIQSNNIEETILESDSDRSSSLDANDEPDTVTVEAALETLALPEEMSEAASDLDSVSTPVPDQITALGSTAEDGNATIMQSSMEEEEAIYSDKSSSLDSYDELAIDTAEAVPETLPPSDETSGSGTASDLESVSTPIPAQMTTIRAASSTAEDDDSIIIQSSMEGEEAIDSDKSSSLDSYDELVIDTAEAAPETLPPSDETSGSGTASDLESVSTPIPAQMTTIKVASSTAEDDSIIIQSSMEGEEAIDSDKSSSLDSYDEPDIGKVEAAPETLPSPAEIYESGIASDLESNTASEASSSAGSGNNIILQSDIGEKQIKDSGSRMFSPLGSTASPDNSTVTSSPNELTSPEKISGLGTEEDLDSASEPLLEQKATSEASASFTEDDKNTAIQSNIDEQADSVFYKSPPLGWTAPYVAATSSQEDLPSPEAISESGMASDLESVSEPLPDQNVKPQAVSMSDRGNETAIRLQSDEQRDSHADKFSSVDLNAPPDTVAVTPSPEALPPPEKASECGTASYMDSVNTPFPNQSDTPAAADSSAEDNVTTVESNIDEKWGDNASDDEEGSYPSDSAQEPAELYLDSLGGRQHNTPSSYVDVQILTKTTPSGGREFTYVPEDTEQRFNSRTTYSYFPTNLTEAPSEGDFATDLSSEASTKEEVYIDDQDDADTVGPKSAFNASTLDSAAIEMEIQALEQMKAEREGSRKKRFEWSKLRPRLPFLRPIKRTDKPKSDRGLQEISDELISLQEEVVDTLSELVSAKKALIEQTQLENTISTLTEEKMQLQVGVTELKGNLLDLGTEFDDLQQQLAATRSELKDAKKALAVQNESDSLVLSKIREEKDQLAVSVSGIKGELKDLGDELLELKDQVSTSLSELNEVKKATDTIKSSRESAIATNSSRTTAPSIESEPEGDIQGKPALVEEGVAATSNNSGVSGIAINSSGAAIQGVAKKAKAAPGGKSVMPTQNTQGLEQVEKSAGWLNLGSRLPFPSPEEGSDKPRSEEELEASGDEPKDVASITPQSSSSSTTFDNSSDSAIPSIESSSGGIAREVESATTEKDVVVTPNNPGASGIATNSSRVTVQGVAKEAKPAAAGKSVTPTQNTQCLEQVEKSAGWLNLGSRLPFPSSAEGPDKPNAKDELEESGVEPKDVAATPPKSAIASTTLENSPDSSIPSIESSSEGIAKEVEFATAEKGVATEAKSFRESTTAKSSAGVSSTASKPEGAFEKRKPAPAEKSITATPTAQAAAKKLKIHLANVKGTGKFGRVTLEDVAVLREKTDDLQRKVDGKETSPAELPKGFVPFTSMQRGIAKNMMNSLSTPVFRVNLDIETDKFDALYQRLKLRVSISTLLAKAVALAIEEHPIMNSSYSPDGGVVRHKDINIAMAVAVEGGLMAPTLRNVNERSIAELGASWRDLVRKARKGTLTPEEYQSGTFAITNMGMFGVTQFDPILPAGMGAILSIGSERNEFLSDETEFIKARPVRKMTVSLTCDHRHIYGTDAANFLNTLDDILNKQLHRLSV